MANHSQTVITVAMAAFSSGWLSGLYFSRRPPRDQDPDWRRSFSHENTNQPGGPPPLKLRRCDPDSPSGLSKCLGSGSKVACGWLENYYLGLYETPQDAALAYDKAAVSMFGLYAKTNKNLGKL